MFEAQSAYCPVPQASSSQESWVWRMFSWIHKWIHVYVMRVLCHGSMNHVHDAERYMNTIPCAGVLFNICKYSCT